MFGLQQRYLMLSLTIHVVILLALIVSYEFSTPLPVFENTNQNDTISAVILGDSVKSKIIPKKLPSIEPVKPVQKPLPPPPKKIASVETPKPPVVEKDAIALKPPKPTPKKPLFQPNSNDLLADLEKEKKVVDKKQQKQLKNLFEKTLREQAEKSLRQQLLDEEIKLQATESRASQGVVDKYKALIIQAISSHWLIPPGANKKLYSELMIRVAPGGAVLDVQITRSSGDVALDQSARAAVLKASPLPVPRSADDFAPFKQFALKVKPENILAGDNLF